MPFASKPEYDPDMRIPGRAYADFLEQEYQLAVVENPDDDVSLGAIVGELLDIAKRFRAENPS